MTKDKLIHTVQLTTAEQAGLMEVLVLLLKVNNLQSAPNTVGFLETMVDRLSDSIVKCSDKEIQYEQAIALERGEA